MNAEYVADVKFFVYMNGVGRWRESAQKCPVTEKIQTERTKIISRILIMINQPVFLRILIPKRDDCLLSEITLCSVRIAREFKEVIYYVLDDNVYYIDDDWGIMVSAFVVWVRIKEDCSPSIMISVPAPSWRASSSFSTAMSRGELERGFAMEKMERNPKRNVKVSVTRKCMFVLETESRFVRLNVGVFVWCWCVLLFKLALFIISIESET